MMKRLLPILALAALSPSTDAAITPKVQRAEAKAFARVEKDGDAKISYEEFKALLTPLEAALRKFPVTGRGDDPAELLELCEAVFDYFDADSDGFVSFNEWLMVRQNLNIGSLADLLEDLPGLDRNGNGQVTILEFLPLVKCFIPSASAKGVYRSILTGHIPFNGGSSGGTLVVGGGATWSGIVTTGDWAASGSISGGTITSDGRGSGGPETGTPLNIGSGTTTGISGGVAAMSARQDPDAGISVTWTRMDPEAAAAWAQQFLRNPSDGVPAEISGGSWGGISESTLPEEGRGRRTGVQAPPAE